MRPTHTPYDGSVKPFSIGLKPIVPDAWIEVDAALPTYLAEKRRLYAEKPEAVFMAEPDTLASQQEVLAALFDFLPRRFRDIYTLASGSISIVGAPDLVTLDSHPDAPLMTASLLVQEDLVIMRESADGWRLVAASVCFPSAWTLAEKFGRPLHHIHTPVPGFGPDSRTASLIARIFDNLKPDQPVVRQNWSLTTDGELFQPVSEAKKTGGTPADTNRFAADDLAASTFIRVERQTLRRMAGSGDILFTIRIHVDPMGVLLDHPRRAELATGFADQLAALEPAHLGYKRITADRDNLVAALRKIANE